MIPSLSPKPNCPQSYPKSHQSDPKITSGPLRCSSSWRPRALLDPSKSLAKMCVCCLWALLGRTMTPSNPQLHASCLPFYVYMPKVAPKWRQSHLHMPNKSQSDPQIDPQFIPSLYKIRGRSVGRGVSYGPPLQYAAKPHALKFNWNLIKCWLSPKLWKSWKIEKYVFLKKVWKSIKLNKNR